MPGHIGTSIAFNTRAVLGKSSVKEMGADELADLRARLDRQGIPTKGISDDLLKGFVEQRMRDFRDKAPTSPAEAATIILDGVREEKWRILVGEDAEALDRRVREHPERAYEPPFLSQVQAEGHFSEVGFAPAPAEPSPEAAGS
jgi:hypothetical protein